MRIVHLAVQIATLETLRNGPELSPSHWQSGGQGRAVVAAAVSWRNGYGRAGGHRLFTANDREPTGIARFLSGVRDSQSGCRTMRNRQ
jgi:hypothetical protein